MTYMLAIYHMLIYESYIYTLNRNALKTLTKLLNWGKTTDN